ncbi:MAG: hypothetical protein AB7P03_11570 [Kofleriaceae bacterium]
MRSILVALAVLTGCGNPSKTTDKTRPPVHDATIGSAAPEPAGPGTEPIAPPTDGAEPTAATGDAGASTHAPSSGHGAAPTKPARDAGAPATSDGKQGEPCRASAPRCEKPLTCVEYYGIAGPRGPKFTSCEIPCPPDRKVSCPSGQSCVTIADGPGAVCR